MEADRQVDREEDKHRDRHANIIYRENTERKMNRKVEKQIDIIKTDAQTQEQTEGQADKHGQSGHRRTDRQNTYIKVEQLMYLNVQKSKLFFKHSNMASKEIKYYKI